MSADEEVEVEPEKPSGLFSRPTVCKQFIRESEGRVYMCKELPNEEGVCPRENYHI